MIEITDSSNHPKYFLVWKTLLAIGVASLSLALVYSSLLPMESAQSVELGMDVVLLGISVNDFRSRRVPNVVTYPMMAVGVGRALLQGDASFAVYWIVLWLLWCGRFMGAGDSKLLMGLFGLFPDVRLAWVVGATVFLTGVPYLAYKHRRTLLSPGDLRGAIGRVGWRIITLQLLPSKSEFEHEAVPFAFAFSLAGAIYLAMRFTSF